MRQYMIYVAVLLGTAIWLVSASAGAASGNGSADSTQEAEDTSASSAAKAASQEQSGTTGKTSTSDKSSGANTEQARARSEANKKVSNTPSPQMIQGAMTASKLVALARKIANEPYQASDMVPEFLRELPPEVYRQIRFKPSAALWNDAGFGYRVRGYLPGMIYDHVVGIRANTGNGTRPFRFEPSKFVWPDPELAKRVPDDLGYAGFVVDRRSNDGVRWWPVLSFRGASYFRARGVNGRFGTYARGLAINTTTANKGAFARFTYFWLEPPEPGRRALTIYALLEAPKVVGAYVFHVVPGHATHTHVKATLFTRARIEKLGVAPLTSMFAWGENSLAYRSNLRPEAHDADGLLVRRPKKGWLWRPLSNPPQLRTVTIPADNVAGFGLMQRDREFEHYRAPEKDYRNRPSVWIVPEKGFDNGYLELIEIPSQSEINHNIQLSWVPDHAIEAGKRLEFSYDIIWSQYSPEPENLGRVVATHVGHPRGPSVNDADKDYIRVQVEFSGGMLGQPAAANAISSQITTFRDVPLHRIRLTPNPHINGWELSFDVPVAALEEPLKLKAYLQTAEGQKRVTEVWRYTLVNR